MNEAGPAVIVTAIGLMDRRGQLRVEIYPPDDADFLADDNVLVAKGKTFRRAVVSLPTIGIARVCVRLPGPGSYTLSLLHDLDGNRKFDVMTDGIGFAGDPRLRWSKPQASAVRFTAGAGLTQLNVTLNYRRGMLTFGPLKAQAE